MLLCQDCFKQVNQRDHPTPIPYFKNLTITSISTASYGLKATVKIERLGYLSNLQRYVDSGHLDFCYCTQCGLSFFMTDEWPTM